MSTPTIDRFTKQFFDIKAQAPGAPFKAVITDEEATAAAREYLENNRDQVKDLIKSKAGVSLDVADPVIEFAPDEVRLSAKGKKGLIKINASASAAVTWDGSLHVEAKSVNVPVISVSPAVINPAIKEPIDQWVKKLQEYAEIRSFRITDGMAMVEGIKK